MATVSAPASLKLGEGVGLLPPSIPPTLAATSPLEAHNPEFFLPEAHECRGAAALCMGQCQFLDSQRATLRRWQESLPMFSRATAPTEPAPEAFALLLLGCSWPWVNPSFHQVWVPRSLKWVPRQENTDKPKSLTPFQGGRGGFCPSHVIHQGAFIGQLCVPDMAFGSLPAVLRSHRAEQDRCAAAVYFWYTCIVYFWAKPEMVLPQNREIRRKALPLRQLSPWAWLRMQCSTGSEPLKLCLWP